MKKQRFQNPKNEYPKQFIGKGLDSRTPKERNYIATMGARATNELKRLKKTTQQLFQAILDEGLSQERIEEIRTLYPSLEPVECTRRVELLVALVSVF
ncbi:hypothetical protein tpqmel_0326 [Candidatus Gastranaerophilus sp. (ex Termes propinquus)]|nr:hypothetical protein tpqmel_0326 [Candidatus Gastranaerophilus sp. (ex Termes propinquus)]